jgi:hypothetical protein
MGNCCGARDADNGHEILKEPYVDTGRDFFSDPPPATDNLLQFIREALQSHNELRRLHYTDPLEYDSELSKNAQKYAEFLVSIGSLQSSDCLINGKEVGESLAYTGGHALTGTDMTNMWYEENRDYDFKTSTTKPGKVAGHFTQLVWKDTKRVGFGLAQKNNAYYAVAYYHPPGNVEGKYKQNVLPK